MTLTGSEVVFVDSGRAGTIYCSLALTGARDHQLTLGDSGAALTIYGTVNCYSHDLDISPGGPEGGGGQVVLYTTLNSPVVVGQGCSLALVDCVVNDNIVLDQGDVIFAISSEKTLDGTINGTGNLYKYGNGKLILTHASSYTGETRIWYGTLSIDNFNELDTSSIKIGWDYGLTYGVLCYTGSTATVDRGITVGVVGGQLDVTNDATLTLTDIITAKGPFTIAVPATPRSPASFPARGSLTKTGSGTLTLSGQNEYTGGTTVDDGTLALAGDNNRLSTDAAITVTGGTLDLGRNTQTTSGIVSFQGGTVQNGTLVESGTHDYDGQAGTVSADLASSVGSSIGLTKSGPGTLTLTGSNTYTGGNTVLGGTLLIGAEPSVFVDSSEFDFQTDLSSGAVVANPPASGECSRSACQA